jgi:hypothetical protein
MNTTTHHSRNGANVRPKNAAAPDDMPRKRRKPRAPIAEPVHEGRYYLRVSVPWICALERRYRASERAERRAKKRAEQRAEQRALKERPA